MGETNRKAAARFSWDVGAQRLIELYGDILQKGGKSKQARFPPSGDRVKGGSSSQGGSVATD
jgi:hypothetical protein